MEWQDRPNTANGSRIGRAVMLTQAAGRFDRPLFLLDSVPNTDKVFGGKPMTPARTNQPERPSLSPKQAAAYSWIVAFVDLNGFSPTYQEIADGRGTSKVSAYEIVQTLRRKGRIRIGKRNTDRNIIVDMQCPHCGQPYERKHHATTDTG